MTLFAYGVLLAFYGRKTDFKVSNQLCESHVNLSTININKVDRQILVRKYEALGPFNFPQKVLIADFFLMAFLWFTRQGFGGGCRFIILMYDSSF